MGCYNSTKYYYKAEIIPNSDTFRRNLIQVMLAEGRFIILS